MSKGYGRAQRHLLTVTTQSKGRWLTLRHVATFYADQLGLTRTDAHRVLLRATRGLVSEGILEKRLGRLRAGHRWLEIRRPDSSVTPDDSEPASSLHNAGMASIRR